jgi:hypothetical protein
MVLIDLMFFISIDLFRMDSQRRIQLQLDEVRSRSKLRRNEMKNKIFF